MKHFLYFSLLLQNVAFSQIQIYPVVPGELPSQDYKVTANGKSVFVHDSPVGALALFGGKEEVIVRVHSTQVVRWASILPSGIVDPPSILDEHTFEFVLPTNTKISVEINGTIENPLFLFYNPIENTHFPKPRPQDIVFEGGKRYRVGQVTLKSGQRVFIKGGAIVDGAFLAENQKDISILGFGILDGTNIRSIEPTTGNDKKRYRNEIRLVHFRRCETINVEGVTLLNSFAWNLVPENSKNVEIKGVNIISGNPSDDGIDIVSSENVRVHGCFVRTKDDCVAIKSLHRPENADDKCRNIRVENCTFWSAEWGNAIEVGYELQYPFIEDIWFNDIRVIRVEKGAVFSIHQTDDSVVRNVSLENIQIENAMDKFVDLGIFFSYFSHDNPYERTYFLENKYLEGPWDNAIQIERKELPQYAPGRGNIQNISFNAITIKGNEPYSILAGYDEIHNISDITFQNIRFNGKPIKSLQDLKAIPQYAKNLKFH